MQETASRRIAHPQQDKKSFLHRSSGQKQSHTASLVKLSSRVPPKGTFFLGTWPKKKKKKVLRVAAITLR